VRKNTVREIWARGETVVNGWLSIPSGFSAEVMAHQGFDSLTVDMQHGVVDYQTGVSMLQGISTTGVIPFARVPWNDPARLMKILDAGAYGVICPMINTAEALKNLDDILSVPGVDAIYVGPSDLSLALGCKPRLDQTDPPVVEAQQMIVKACKKHGVVAGIHNATAAYSVKMIDEGYQFVTLASDSRHMAMKAAEEVAVVRKTGKVGGKLPAY